MKKYLLSAATIISISLSAQDFTSAGAYMTAMANTHKEMDQKYMAYTSAVAHGKRARKVEKLREKVLESIENTRVKVSDLPFYNGDNSLRKSNLDYIQFCYNIFNDDYAHIVNLEEISEQSFDEMQAYLLLREKVDEKIKNAVDTVNKAQDLFVKKYNIQLIGNGEKNDLSLKIEAAHNVNRYYNTIYLLLFKCRWQYTAMTKALNEKRINDAEQARNAVIKYAAEGLQGLKNVKPYEGDNTLMESSINALQTYKSIAEKETVMQIDYFLKTENFEKIKKAFEAKSDKTKSDLDEYNKAVKEINASVNSSNQASSDSNKKTSEALTDWENSVKKFFDTYTPYY